MAAFTYQLTKGENERVLTAIHRLEGQRESLQRFTEKLIVAGRPYNPYVNTVREAIASIGAAERALLTIAAYSPKDYSPPKL